MMKEKEIDDIINEGNEGNEENEAEETAVEETAEAPADDNKNKKEDKKLKSKIAALEKEIEALKAKATDDNDKYLRLAAEYDNFRKRSQKEREGIYSDAVSDTVNELLPLFDNLERASAYTDGDKVAEGLAMILKTIPDVLSKLKIEAFGEKGDTFDPNIHNAIMHEENEEYGEGEIVEVFQKGYKVGEKIIRYAMVKVAN